MNSNQLISIEPTCFPHPGEIVTEYLEFHGWSHNDLANRLGLKRNEVHKICSGRASIGPDTALRLERVFQRPAHLWLSLQKQFDSTRLL